MTAVDDRSAEDRRILVNRQDNIGRTALHYLCDCERFNSSLMIAQILLDTYGANHCINDNRFMMPIHYAIIGSNIELQKLLLGRMPTHVRDGLWIPTSTIEGRVTLLVYIIKHKLDFSLGEWVVRTFYNSPDSTPCDSIDIIHNICATKKNCWGPNKIHEAKRVVQVR